MRAKSRYRAVQVMTGESFEYMAMQDETKEDALLRILNGTDVLDNWLAGMLISARGSQPMESIARNYLNKKM